MAGNVRALTDEELKYFVENYEFTLKDEDIIVKKKTYGLRTLHDASQAFSINDRVINRVIRITKEAIDLWIDKFMDSYSLIEVQAAINRLTVLYQDLTTEEIAKQMKVSHDTLDLK